MAPKAPPSISLTPAGESQGAVTISIDSPPASGRHKLSPGIVLRPLVQFPIASPESNPIAEAKAHSGISKQTTAIPIYDDRHGIVASPLSKSVSELEEYSTWPDSTGSPIKKYKAGNGLTRSSTLSPFDEPDNLKVSLRRSHTEIQQPFQQKKRSRNRDLAGLISRTMHKIDDVGLHRGHPYISEQKVCEHLTRDNLAKTFHRASEELLDFAFANKKVSCLIVLSLSDPNSRNSALTAFYQYKFSDDCLPIEKMTKEEICSFRSESSASEDDDDDEDKPCEARNPDSRTRQKCQHISEADAFHCWPGDETSMIYFYDQQWHFLVPSFDGNNRFRKEFHHKLILPFKNLDSQSSDHGHFGHVSKYMMLSDHQDVIRTDNREIPVAIKELKTYDNDIRADWENECHALNTFNEFNDEHIVKGIGGFRQQSNYYIIMEWADGGSLADVWRREPSPHLELDGSRILEMLRQFRGLANALHRMHDYQSQDSSLRRMSWRHGDLKPGNILQFTDSLSWLGTLKLADLGRAKQHTERTGNRKVPTSEVFVSKRYEAPETSHTMSSAPRSRLYDIWSLGCIMLDCTVWLLYGLEQVNKIFATQGGEVSPYWMNERGGGTSAKVRNSISDFMQAMLEADPECSSPSALRDLIILIKEKLLVVRLPDDASDPSPGRRTNSLTLRNELDRIIENAEQDSSYLFKGSNRSNVVAPVIGVDMRGGSKQSFLNPENIVTKNPSPLFGNPNEGADQSSYSHGFDNNWKFQVDNDFARKILLRDEIEAHRLLPSKASSLCNECCRLEFDAPDFTINDTLSELLEKTKTGCQFCSMRLRVAERYQATEQVKFDLFTSGLRMNGACLPVMSLCRTSDSVEWSDSTSRYVQIGLPTIPKAGSAAHFDLLRAWLEDCDANHHICHQFYTRRENPTRLLDVGSEEFPSLRLVESSSLTEREKSPIKYIALSHPWGDPEKHKHACTTRENAHEYMEVIRDVLPQTLADAVTITRGLGVRYLWIDSLCIIQGPGGDFVYEAERMETVFSLAYCVIAATSAEGSSSGFLTRNSRREIGRESENGPISIPYSSERMSSSDVVYVDEAFDNFEEDVSNGPLNKRGWVFQERALARRTIHFTSNQTYWECGAGIRCETLMKMWNTQEAFLGDPNFPRYGLQGNRGGDIVFYERLYEQYSGLKFTRPEDRPVAIAGLERRLLRALEEKIGIGLGSFGIFDKYWGRGLLWHRASDEPKMIRLKSGVIQGAKAAPSWSWMGHTGSISFLKPEPNTVSWLANEVMLPWKTGERQSTTSYRGELGIKGTARNFRVSKDDKDAANKVKIVFEDPEQRLEAEGLKCLVIGKLNVKDHSINQVRNYVLILAKKESSTRVNAYERVGAGFIHGSLIEFDGPQLSVWVE